MSTQFSFLNLSYLAEISFVANLAYFELKTYKLREQLKSESDRIEKLYISEDSENSNLIGHIGENGKALLEPEWSRLRHFDRVEYGAWGTKCLHWVYKKLIFSQADRRIVGLIMFSDALSLIIFTGTVGLSINAADHLVWWWIAFFLLSLSCLIPALLMWLVMTCKRYAFGQNNKKGRIYHLGQEFMKKLRAYSLDKMGI